MEDYLKKLSDKERETLYKAPALVSLIAASTDGVIDATERARAKELSKMRTFTAEKELQPFYKEAEKRFEDAMIKGTDRNNLIGSKEKAAIKDELEQVDKILSKIDKNYAGHLQESFKSYAKHVSESHKNFVADALFPVNIPGLSEK